jgi:hypothetical protein
VICEWKIEGSHGTEAIRKMLASSTKNVPIPGWIDTAFEKSRGGFWPERFQRTEDWPHRCIVIIQTLARHSKPRYRRKETLSCHDNW